MQWSINMETHTTTIADKTSRYRVNFSSSVKGIISPEVTVELVNGTKEDALKEAEELLKNALIIARNHTTQ